MKGTLKKRGQYWYVIVDLKNESGNRKQKWINTKCEKKPDAERALREILTQIDKNTYITPQKTTFIEHMSYWLYDVIKNNVEYTTWQSYELVVSKHIIPFFKRYFSGLLLQDLQPIHLQKYYAYMHDDKGLSGNTLRKHHANIKSALDFAVRMNLISLNPAEKIKLPKKEKFKGSYYTVEQLEDLFEICSGTPIEAAVYLAGNYGLRRGEVLGLKWDAINFKEDTIIIKETRVKFGNEEIIKKPKSESSYRVLPMMKSMKEYLKTLKAKQELNKSKYEDDYIDKGYVCCWEDGTPIKSEFLNHKFKQIIKKNNMPPIRFHDLRHSTASFLLKNGMSLKDIQVWLGHADIGTTADIYAHIDFEMKKNTAEKINKIFKERSNEESD